MKNIFWGFVVALGLLAVLIWGLDNLAQSRADLVYQQARAQAVIIEAQGQARLDSAQAAAVTSAAMLPWLIVFCTSGVVIVCVVFLLRQPVNPPPAQLIERHIYYLPAPGQTEILLPARPKKEIIHEQNF